MLTTRSIVASLALILLLSASAMAEVPSMISYQGKLMQPSGAPVPDGTYSLRFAIYDAPTAGNTLWSEPNDSVHVKGGLFSVLLGSVINMPANIFDSPDRFFGVRVGADQEMTPRQRIASSAFSFRSAVAGTVDDGAITAAKIANAAVTADKVADGVLTDVKLASGVATPAGTVSMFGGSSAPTGWLLCDGCAVSRTAYSSLFAAIGTIYGSGDGVITFNLPDFRGVFPKGAGVTSRTGGKDAFGSSYAATLGAYSTDQLQGHRHHSVVVFSTSPGSDQWCLSFVGNNPGVSWQDYGNWDVLEPSSDGVNGTPRTGRTTEPQSLAVSYIIKY